MATTNKTESTAKAAQTTLKAEEQKKAETKKPEPKKAEAKKESNAAVKAPSGSAETVVKKRGPGRPAGSGKKSSATRKNARKTSKATIRRVASEVEAEVFVQVFGEEYSQQEIMEKVVAAWEAEGKKVTSIKRAKLYVKPEEGKAYFVVNEGLKNGTSGAVEL